MYYFLSPQEYLNPSPDTLLEGKPFTQGYAQYVERMRREGKEPLSPERLVYARIRNQIFIKRLTVDVDPNEKKKGFFSSLFGVTARAGMYSSDSTVARQSIVLVASQEIERQRAWMNARDRRAQLESEYRKALALADEYFHGEERRQQAVNEEMARMRLQAEMIAEAIVRQQATQAPQPGGQH